MSPDSTRILNRILSVTRLHIHVFYPCTLVYTCNSNLVPNTLAVFSSPRILMILRLLYRFVRACVNRLHQAVFPPKKRPGPEASVKLDCDLYQRNV